MVDQEIATFETDRGFFQTDINLTVIERDVLFNDVGSVKGDLKINTSTTAPQQFIFEVKTRESRSFLGRFWGVKTAVFEIMLEAVVVENVKYVPDLDESQVF